MLYLSRHWDEVWDWLWKINLLNFRVQIRVHMIAMYSCCYKLRFFSIIQMLVVCVSFVVML